MARRTDSDADAVRAAAPEAGARHDGSANRSLVGASLAGRLMKRLPGGSFAERQLERAETRVFDRLKARLDAVDGADERPMFAVAVTSTRSDGQKPGGMPGNLLRDLLERAQEMRSREQAEAEYFTLLLRQMVPDEARILSALSDGVVYPVIDVLTASRLSVVARPVVESVSNVGKAAGVQAPDLTPNYVRHLRRLGLVDIVPGQTPELQQYQILETDSEVRGAVDAARKHGQRASILRRSLRISLVGKRMWVACRVSEEPPQSWESLEPQE